MLLVVRSLSGWPQRDPCSAFRKHVLRPALAAADLPQGLRTYDLRHAHASLLIDLGANVPGSTVTYSRAARSSSPRSSTSSAARRSPHYPATSSTSTFVASRADRQRVPTGPVSDARLSLLTRIGVVPRSGARLQQPAVSRSLPVWTGTWRSSSQEYGPLEVSVVHDNRGDGHRVALVDVGDLGGKVPVAVQCLGLLSSAFHVRVSGRSPAHR